MQRWFTRASMPALLCVLMVVPAHAAYGPAELLFTFKGGEITESSGIAQSRLDPSITFTHNDSGENLGRFFAVDRSGFTVTEYALRGSLSADWEDMASGPGVDGVPSLFFADMGDNYEFRTVVQIYEVAEPIVQLGMPSAVVMPTRAHLLAFEDGPHNAESFLVDPRDGAFAIVTKDADGQSGVYVADPIGASGAPRLLRRVAGIRFDQLASQATTSARESTGGDIAPDRSRLVVRTYLEAFEWELGTRTLAEAVAQAPLRIALPTTRQGEAIAYTNTADALLISSEGALAPVHRVPVI